ncbi:putative covalently-linked cell wall protein [Podospora conica]|nr:putative covalently-linked cell wall protein [Schizothecium conicum]
MKFQAITLLLATATSAVAQGVTDSISPSTPAPPGCKPSFDGKFELHIQELNDTKVVQPTLQGRSSRVCTTGLALVSEITDGVMTDAHNRIAYIADNFQLQFDGPPQAGAIYTSGFSVCGNGTIALGGSTVFYQCKSGDFYNLYDRWFAEQCSPVQLYVLPCGGEVTDPQNVVGSAVVSTTVVMPLSDGQPQVITTTTLIPMCQIGDGQVQVRTTPCDAIPSATETPVEQGPDGQIEFTPAPSVPSATVPVAVPTAPNGTLRNTPAPSVVPTNAPLNSAGQLQMGSAAALVVGILGAVIAL